MHEKAVEMGLSHQAYGFLCCMTAAEMARSAGDAAAAARLEERALAQAPHLTDDDWLSLASL